MRYCIYCGVENHRYSPMCYNCAEKLHLVKELVEAGKELKKKNHNTCVMCGEVIPEGRLTCPKCEHKINNAKCSGALNFALSFIKAKGLEVEFERYKTDRSKL